MKNFFLLILLFILAGSCSLFEDDEDEALKLSSAEFYETGDSDYPVIAVDETQAIFGFSNDLNELYAEQANGEKWLVKVKNGFPESMQIKKGDLSLLVLFSEFDGDIANIAVIDQVKGTTHYFYNIEFTNISTTAGFYAKIQPQLKSAGDNTVDIVDWWNTYGEAVKKMAGPVIGGVGCGLSAITAVGSGGWATPIAVLSCGSWASSLSGDIVGEESTAGGALFKGGSVAGKYGEMVLKCGTQNWGACALGVTGEIGSIYNIINYSLEKSEANKAKQFIEAYVKTGGLAGTWESEETAVAGGSAKANYYFGLHAGRHIQISKLSQSSTQLNTTAKMDFNYSVNKNTISMTMTRIQIDMTTTQGGLTATQTLGPLTWEEFMQTALHGSGGYGDKTVSMKFEIKDDGQKLVFDNGTELQRVQ